MFPEEFFLDSGPIGQRILNRDFLERIRLGEDIDRSDVDVAVALVRLAHDELEAYGTDGTQRTSDDEIRRVLQTCRRVLKRIGISFDLPFSDFRRFRSHWLANGGYGSWQARRDILNALFEPVHRQLAHREDMAVNVQTPADWTEAPVPVSSAESLRPLPPSSTQMSTPRDQPATTERVDASTAEIGDEKQWDVFISYATEDKETVAGPLAEALRTQGVSVWYDQFELRIGQSLRRSIDSGIAQSRYGLVILSKPYFEKDWPQHELDGLVAKTNSDKQHILLPIWHEISRGEVIKHSAPLADRVALLTADCEIDEIADKIASVVVGGQVPSAGADTKPSPPPRTHSHGMNNVALTAGPKRHFLPGVTVSPHSDPQGRYYLDVRKNDISSNDYVSLCNDLAATQGSDGWHARLNIGGLTFDFDSCQITPKGTAKNRYYVDVRAHTDASGYKQVMKALAAAATPRQ